ncbi:MAG: transglycosylase SLT domain-containing protein [Candidatus Dormibacteria bacterium]
MAVARCESGLDPYALNPAGPYEGLFQFLPRTFAAHGGTNIWDPVQQSDIAAAMFAAGQGSAWGSCATA